MSKWLTDDLNAKLQAADTLKAAADRVRSSNVSNYQFVNDEKGLFIGVFIPKVAGTEADSLLSQRIDDWKQNAGTFPVPPAEETKAITDADESALQAEATAPVDSTSSGNGSDEPSNTAGPNASDDQPR